jgi:hypothetical protein
MSIQLQTEQIYSGDESVGVAVSPSFNIPCPTLLIFPPIGARRLRHALVDLRLVHVRYPRGLYRFT